MIITIYIVDMKIYQIFITLHLACQLINFVCKSAEIVVYLNVKLIGYSSDLRSRTYYINIVDVLRCGVLQLHLNKKQTFT